MNPHLVETPAVATRRREDLRVKIDRLAGALAAGEITMSAIEFDALAEICADHCLPIEAARVRRWIAAWRCPACGWPHNNTLASNPSRCGKCGRPKPETAA